MRRGGGVLTRSDTWVRHRCSQHRIDCRWLIVSWNSYSYAKGTVSPRSSGPIHLAPLKRDGRHHSMPSAVPTLDLSDVVLSLQLAVEDLRQTSGFGEHSEDPMERCSGRFEWVVDQGGGGRIDRGSVEWGEERGLGLDEGFEVGW
jgi:hypothetical protein